MCVWQIRGDIIQAVRDGCGPVENLVWVVDMLNIWQPFSPGKPHVALPSCKARYTVWSILKVVHMVTIRAAGNGIVMARMWRRVNIEVGRIGILV
jgi:hypothetical protein